MFSIFLRTKKACAHFIGNKKHKVGLGEILGGAVPLEVYA